MITPCAFSGCTGLTGGGKGGAKGFCPAHYYQLKTGKPLRPVHRPNVRAWCDHHSTYQDDKCLKWPFVTKKDGRGHLTIDGKIKAAHRHMCELAHGPAPSPQHDAAHSCGNGHLGCVSPKHLRWATKAENCKDKFLHGTDQRGERHGMAKLTEEQVAIIKALVTKRAKRAVAREFGVSHCTVMRIANGRNWGWVKPNIEALNGPR